MHALSLIAFFPFMQAKSFSAEVAVIIAQLENIGKLLKIVWKAFKIWGFRAFALCFPRFRQRSAK